MQSRDLNLLILGVETSSELGLVLLDLLTRICMNDVRCVSPYRQEWIPGLRFPQAVGVVVDKRLLTLLGRCKARFLIPPFYFAFSIDFMAKTSPLPDIWRWVGASFTYVSPSLSLTQHNRL